MVRFFDKVDTMAHNAANFIRRVVDDAFEKGLDAKQFATRLGAKQVSDIPCPRWDGERIGFVWRFRDGSMAIIRDDGHEVMKLDSGIGKYLKQHYA